MRGLSGIPGRMKIQTHHPVIHSRTVIVAVTILLVACADSGTSLRGSATPIQRFATATPLPTSTPVAVIPTVPIPTSFPLPTASPLPVDTPTPVPTPTPTAVPTAAPPTPSPTPSVDDRFGIIASGPARDWQVQNLGARWFIDFDSDPGDAPAGATKVPFIQVAPRVNRMPPARIQELTASAPGSVWYIGGEPNVAAQGNMTPENFVDEFDYYFKEIKGADPTALITGPSILNWDFTCTGCGGFTSGETWMRGFVDAYAARHGGESPPIDIWAIDAYPLTWNTVPMTNWQIVRDQIIGFRNFLDQEVPGHSGTPIWVTELASHWAFSEWTISNNRLAIPSNLDIELDYQWDAMEDYMDGILGWLKANGPSMQIDRWFFFKGYADIATTSGDGYAGIYFYEDGSNSSALNQLGAVYGDYISRKR